MHNGSLALYRFFFLSIIFLSIIGCSECSLDSCNYDPEEIAVWSETDSSLAVIIEDLGERDVPKDNVKFLYTLALDGSDFKKISRLTDDQYIAFFNEGYQYVLLAGTTEHNYRRVTTSFEKIDLSNGNTSILANIGSEPCLDYRAIPSLDGSHIARVKIKGEENGTLQFSVTSGNVTSTQTSFSYQHNLESNIGCANLIIEVEFVNAITGDVVATASSVNPDLGYRIYKGNLMEAFIEPVWGQTGLIIQNFDLTNISSEYALITLSGAVSGYAKPDECGQHATSSGRFSQNGSEAIVIGFEGATEANVEVKEGVIERNIVCTP